MHISSPPIPKGHEHVSELVVGAECEATQTLLHDVIITNLVARLIGMELIYGLDHHPSIPTSQQNHTTNTEHKRKC